MQPCTQKHSILSGEQFDPSFFQLEGVRSTDSDPIRIREAGELVDRRSSEAFSGDEGGRGGHGVHHLPGGQPESDSLYQSTELAVDSRLKMTL